MTVDSTQLLKHLEPAVRPGSANGSSGAFRAPIEAQGFSSLLEQAGRGELASDQPVGVAEGLGASLGSDEHRRLSQAADTAEALGAQRAVVMMNGRALMLDVPTRTIESDAGTSGVRGRRVDAVVNADEGSESEAAGGADLLHRLGQSAIGVRLKLDLE